MKHLLGAICLLLAACSKGPSKIEKGNVELKSGTVQYLGTSNEILVMSRDALMGNPGLPTKRNDLLVGLPLNQFGKLHNWGGVIVAVKAPTNPAINSLKLAAMPNMGVILKRSFQNIALEYKGKPILSLDIVGEKKGHVLVDLEPLGKELNLYALMKRGQESPYVSVSNQTVRINYTAPTITFDIQSVMQNKDVPEDKIAITTRWYLSRARPNSRFFKSRPMTKGVGFFGTENFTKGNVSVFDIHETGKASIPVVLKNFPDVMKQSAASALEQWNNVFQKHLGVRPITYKFLDVTDPRQNLIMAGDVRFNVIEWDIYNQAPYEGLGPCIGSKEQGKTLSCASLIQGPKITYRTARIFGSNELIGRVLGTKAPSVSLELMDNPIKNLKLNMGMLKFEVPALKAELKDEMHESGGHSMEPPLHMDPLAYLQQYIQGVVAHEFGHNLGLRHNFKGSLFADNKRITGSIMDYLFTFNEHHSHVQEYDSMAIAYGYAGKKPARTDMFCTDEHVYSRKKINNSVECRRFDLTSDPYGFYKNLVKGILGQSLAGDPMQTIKRKAGMINFALEGIMGHGVNIIMGVKTNAFTAEKAKQKAQFGKVYKDLYYLYCGYRGELNKVALIGQPVDLEFQRIFNRNTKDFLPRIFPEGGMKCSFDKEDPSNSPSGKTVAVTR